MNKIVKSIVENNLMQFNDESKFEKIKKIDTHFDFKSLIKKDDYIFFIGNGFIVLNGKCNSFVNLQNKYPQARLVGKCIADSERMDDTFPRIVSMHMTEYAVGPYIFSTMWNTDKIGVDDAYKELSEYNIDNGWENTEVLLKYDIRIANAVKKYGDYYYIPSIQEIRLLDKQAYSSNYWTSTINGATLTPIYYQASNNESWTINVDAKLYCIPFLYIDTYDVKGYLYE